MTWKGLIYTNFIVPLFDYCVFTILIILFVEAKLTFGIHKGHLIHISLVESGLRCNCICPACNQKLIARKGAKTVHHFAHYKATDCIGATETALHMAAKEILESHKRIQLPAVLTSLGSGQGMSICLFKKQILRFERVFLEKRIDRIIPDIIIEKQGRSLIIEITVTHGIDAIKKNRIKKLNISTLEIDLRNHVQHINADELEKILIYGIGNKNWVYNSKRQAFRDKIVSLGKALPLYYRNVYKCPLFLNDLSGKKHVDLLDDCFGCNYLIHANGDASKSHKHIICVGHAVKEIEKIFARYNAIEY
jgi:hypothetical protein